MSQGEVVGLHNEFIEKYHFFTEYITLRVLFPSAGRQIQLLKISFTPILMLLGLYFCICTVADAEDNFTRINCLVYAGAYYQGLFKYYILFAGNQKNFKDLLEYMRSLTRSGNLIFAYEIRRKRLKRSISIAFICSKAIIYMINLTAIAMSIFGLYRTNLCYPMLFRIPLQIFRETWQNCLINILFTYTSFPILAQVVVFGDSLLYVILAYFVAELSAIVEIIGHLNDKEVVKENSKEILKFIYKSHMDVIHYLRILQTIVWHLNIHLIGTNFFYLCLLLFMARFYDMDIPNYMALISSIFQLFVLCFFGQILRNRTEAIGDALYNTCWYDMDQKEKVALLIMMASGQEPMGLEAGGILNLSFNTFAIVMRNAISYGAFLYTVME